MIWVQHILFWIGLNEIINKNKEEKTKMIWYSLLGSVILDFDLVFSMINLWYIWHKTLTHSLLFVSILFLINYLFFRKYLIFSYAAFLHLLCDIFVWWKIFIYWFWKDKNFWISYNTPSILDPTKDLFLYYFIISSFIILFYLLKNKVKNLFVLFLFFLAFSADIYYFLIK